VVGLSCPLAIFFDPEDGRERERLGSCVRCFDDVRVMSWPLLRLDSRGGLPATSWSGDSCSFKLLGVVGRG